jgi:hypothetical protein
MPQLFAGQLLNFTIAGTNLANVGVLRGNVGRPPDAHASHHDEHGNGDENNGRKKFHDSSFRFDVDESLVTYWLPRPPPDGDGFGPCQRAVVSELVFSENTLSQGLQRLIGKISDGPQVFVGTKTFADNIKHGERLDVATITRSLYDPTPSGGRF